MTFNPDQYLQEKQISQGFDPDVYLSEKTAQPQQPQYGTKDYIGDIARPVLETGGMVGGGLLGLASPLPGGAAIGGALGYGGGKAAADLLDRGLGRKPMLQNFPQAALETGKDISSGVGAEMIGQGIGKATKPILGAIGKAGTTMGEWATGIPARDFQSVAKNPGSILPGTMAKAGTQFETAMQNAGISSELTPEAIDRIRKPGEFAFDTFNKLKTTGSITPQEALHARQSIDAIYPIPNKKNGAYIRTLDQIRQTMQDVIANTSPEIKQASTDYSIAKSGSKFQNILPQTNSGKPSYFRSGAILAGIAAGHPMALLGSPVVAGAVTAGAGLINKGAETVAKNPSLQRTFGNLILSKSKALEFLKQADYDPDKARELARQQGYTGINQ
jgi:hypothetical protein